MSTEVPFLDIVKLTQKEIERAKIKFNQWDQNEDPLDVFLTDPQLVNDGWLFWKAQRRYFEVGELAINFVQYSSDTWLLTTIKEVVREDKEVTNSTAYEGDERSEFAHLYGRLIIKYLKDSRISVRKAKGIIETIYVDQLLPKVYDGDGFAGYDNVHLSFAQLESIVNRQKQDWVNALVNQKAVYLITDTSNGMLYVGSATGDNGMLLQRWSDYISDGHGGNQDLKKLVTQNGFDYIKKNFQYSILENFNARVDKEIILKRENWWKETLCSRKHGYNKN